MAHGIKVWGPGNVLWMDTTLITWNLVEVYTVEAGITDERTYTGIYADREFLVVQIPLDVPKVDDYTYQKTIAVAPTYTSGALTGQRVTVYGGNQRASILVMCR